MMEGKRITVKAPPLSVEVLRTLETHIASDAPVSQQTCNGRLQSFPHSRHPMRGGGSGFLELEA